MYHSSPRPRRPLTKSKEGVPAELATRASLVVCGLVVGANSLCKGVRRPPRGGRQVWSIGWGFVGISSFGFRASFGFRHSDFGFPRSAALLLALIPLPPPSAPAQPSIQPVLTNGPASNRLNIVLLSEGYTSDELSGFLLDATNAITGLLAHPPYTEYSNYFNAFGITVASTQSGSDHPTSGIFRDTY